MAGATASTGGRMLRIRNIPDPVYLRLQAEARAKNTTVAAMMRDLIVARDTKKYGATASTTQQGE